MTKRCRKPPPRYPAPDSSSPDIKRKKRANTGDPAVGKPRKKSKKAKPSTKSSDQELILTEETANKLNIPLNNEAVDSMGFVPFETGGLGTCNCFFSSLVDQLGAIKYKNPPKSHEIARAAICTHIEQNPENFIDVINGMSGGAEEGDAKRSEEEPSRIALSNYLKNMRMQGTYADDPEIAAAADCYKN